ncbi:MAG: family 16 glycosylhydrolase [Candidatus Hydrogenedentes bacterium]|nr:family 16 glycosylhydrolase [Candidatus Hydrogenedentota bacterium]
MIVRIGMFSLSLLLLAGCQHSRVSETIDLFESWHFAPDEQGVGFAEEWHSPQFDDSQWDTIDAGLRWEDQGYRELDGFGWYRKRVEIPAGWEGQEVWIKFGGTNDAYTLFINGESVSSFGAANISFASKPSFSKVTKYLNYGKSNLIVVQVNDWGNSGGLWRLPIVITTDANEVNNLFKPMSATRYTPEDLGYQLFWEDQFEGDTLDSEKWAVRGEGPRAVGFVSSEAVKVKDGFLELAAFVKDDAILVGAVGTHNRFMTKYGYFECRAQLQKSAGNWSAFWIQSTGISQGEDPAVYGVEIDIMEYFKKSGEDIVSHNLHWAYGPNQQTVGALESKREGISEGFHTFAVEWTPEKYAFFVDGYKYYEVTRAISHVEEYMILSMELPGTMEALKDAVFPDVFIVDYVKVYKKK